MTFAAAVLAAVFTATSGDPAIERARGLLDVKVTVPIVVVHPTTAEAEMRIRAAVKRSAAWVTRDRSAIYVQAASEAYRRAKKGDVIVLAAVIAHEQVHIASGPDEGPAYAVQIQALRKLGASERDIRNVEKAAAKVLRVE